MRADLPGMPCCESVSLPGAPTLQAGERKRCLALRAGMGNGCSGVDRFVRTAAWSGQVLCRGVAIARVGCARGPWQQSRMDSSPYLAQRQTAGERGTGAAGSHRPRCSAQGVSSEQVHHLAVVQGAKTARAEGRCLTSYSCCKKCSIAVLETKSEPGFCATSHATTRSCGEQLLSNE